MLRQMPLPRDAHECSGPAHSRATLLATTGTRNVEYKKYMCIVCGWVYDEEQGWPEDGIAPGTRWEDVPLNWTCPDCGAAKEDFEMVEV